MKKIYSLARMAFSVALFSVALINYSQAQATDSEIHFDGVDDYIYTNEFPTIDGSFTIECYFRSDSISAMDATFWNFDGYSFSPWLGTYSDSSVTFYDGGSLHSTQAGSILPGVTYHVAFVWDGAEGRLYLDGVLTDALADIPTPPGGILSVGDTEQDGGYPFGGFLDELHFSDIARYSGSNVTIPPLPWTPDPNTVALYHFDECADQIAWADGEDLPLILGSNLDPEQYDPTWSCTASGIDDEFKSQVSVFPNPTNKSVSIDLGAFYSKVRMELSDVSGKLIRSESFDQASFIEVDLDKPSGVYFIHLFMDEHSATFKLIKH